MTSKVASEADLLDVLDRGGPVSMPQRALLLAQAADRDADTTALSLGARDRLILRLHEDLFGPTLEARDSCPHCQEPASFELSCVSLVQTHERAGDGPDTVIDLRIGGFEVRCRPPRAVDLVAAARTDHARAARDALLAATILAATRDGDPVTAASLPPHVVDQVGRRLAEADPLAEVRLAVTCPACGGAWHAVLDPAAFVWQELQDWGRTVLWEVHVLATAYGWPEREILSLSPRRRQAYIGLVIGG